MLATNSVAQAQQPNTSIYYITPRTTEPSPPETYDLNLAKRPKQPLYIPAALRPTEHNNSRTIPDRPRAPDTPPPSKGNSFDSANSANAPQPTSAGSSTSLPTLPTAPLHRSTASWGPSVFAPSSPTNPIDTSIFIPAFSFEDEVLGPPVTSHWKPNETSPNCALCQATFTWYFRRHHCRKCGHVVCGSHSANLVPLDQNARFHPKGYMSRACDLCSMEWNRCQKELRLSTGSEGSMGGSGMLAVPGQMQSDEEAQKQLIGAEAKSLGVYGNWSTF